MYNLYSRNADGPTIVRAKAESFRTGEVIDLTEQWTKEAQGRKVLYSYSYYTPEEFWSIYPKKEYDRLRQAYHANTWMQLDQKVLSHFSRIQGNSN